MNKFWGHLKTITHHRHLVMRGCFRMGLIWQGLTHDLSKYSPTEFFAGVRYYQGNRSPNTAEREANGYSLAWMHHKGRNRHHFEYWTDYGVSGEGIIGVEMPKKYGVPALIVATLIAFSRLYVGVHYPFDVIAGVLTGTIYAVITVAIYRKFFKGKKHSEK